MTLHEVLYVIREAFEADELPVNEASQMAYDAIWLWKVPDGRLGFYLRRRRALLIAWALEWVWSCSWRYYADETDADETDADADWREWDGFRKATGVWDGWSYCEAPSAPWLNDDVHAPRDPFYELRYGGCLPLHRAQLIGWMSKYRPEQLAAFEADDGVPF